MMQQLPDDAGKRVSNGQMEKNYFSFTLAGHGFYVSLTARSQRFEQVATRLPHFADQCQTSRTRSLRRPTCAPRKRSSRVYLSVEAHPDRETPIGHHRPQQIGCSAIDPSKLETYLSYSGS